MSASAACRLQLVSLWRGALALSGGSDGFHSPWPLLIAEELHAGRLQHQFGSSLSVYGMVPLCSSLAVMVFVHLGSS